jgi:hypothetical protein
MEVLNLFNKEKFSELLIKIVKTYDTKTEFSKVSNTDRTYISKFIRMNLNNPPSPSILKRIAEHSNGITTYEELMMICGHIENSSEKTQEEKIDEIYNRSKNSVMLKDTFYDISREDEMLLKQMIKRMLEKRAK